MDVRKIYYLSGYLSVILGVIATACIFRIQFLRWGVLFALIGLICALLNIFLNAKYFAEQDKIPKGYFGMFLSSLPVIFLMLLIFNSKK